MSDLIDRAALLVELRASYDNPGFAASPDYYGGLGLAIDAIESAPSPALTRETPICGPNCEKCGPEVQADSPRSERTAHEALRRVFSLGTVKGAVVVRATPGHLADEVLRELAAQGFSVVRVPPPSSTREET